MTTRKSLFSRRQLNVIIIVTVTVIALLSLPSNPWPQIQRQLLQQVPLNYIIDNQRPIELRLIFALPQPSLLPRESVRVLTRLLSDRLQQATADISATLHRDRLTISLQASAIEALKQQLSHIPSLLLTPFSRTNSSAAIKHRLAERHLNKKTNPPLQSIDRWLQGLSHEAQPPHVTEQQISDLQQQLFSHNRLRLSLTGPDPEPLSGAINALLAQIESARFEPAAQRRQSHQAAQNASASPASQTTELAAGIALQSLPGRQSADFPSRLLLSRILSGLTENTRLQLHPGSQTSWLIWLQPAAATQHQNQSQWLTAQRQSIQRQLANMKDWELERAADTLREQLQQRLQQPQALNEQLEVIAFYQLPVDYSAQFDATIARLTGAELRQLLLDQLQPQRFIQSTAQAAPAPASDRTSATTPSDP